MFTHIEPTVRFEDRNETRVHLLPDVLLIAVQHRNQHLPNVHAVVEVRMGQQKIAHTFYSNFADLLLFSKVLLVELLAASQLLGKSFTVDEEFFVLQQQFVFIAHSSQSRFLH